MTIDEPRSAHARDCQHNWTIQDYESDFDKIDVTHYCPVCDTTDETTLYPTSETKNQLDQFQKLKDNISDDVESLELKIDEEASVPYELAARVHISYENGEEEIRQDLHQFTPE